jgi:hypothetical protein
LFELQNMYIVELLLLLIFTGRKSSINIVTSLTPFIVTQHQIKIVYLQPLFCFLSINSPIFLSHAFLVVHNIDVADIKEFTTNDTLKTTS